MMDEVRELDAAEVEDALTYFKFMFARGEYGSIERHHLNSLIRTALQRPADYGHLKEEKRIQDDINQVWASDARKEYRELKSQVDWLVKTLQLFIDAWDDNESESDMFNKCSNACIEAKKVIQHLSANDVIREERIVTPHDVLEFGGHYLINRFEEAGWQLIAVRPPTLKEPQ